MGSIIGGIVGGIGSLIGGNKQASADKQAAQQALTGYNYLTTGAGAAPTSSYIQNGAGANNAIAQLLGTQPVTSQTQNGFNNYLNSTGYNFQLKQGQNAITSDAAFKGLLNSGATLKALTQYGQGLAGKTFNNYLNQLGSLSGSGQNALNQVAAAGSTGGAGAARATQAGGAAQGNGIATAAGTFGNVIADLF